MKNIIITVIIVTILEIILGAIIYALAVFYTNITDFTLWDSSTKGSCIFGFILSQFIVAVISGTTLSAINKGGPLNP